VTAVTVTTEEECCVCCFLPCQFVPQVRKIKTTYAFNQMPQLAKLPTNGKPQKSKIPLLAMNLLFRVKLIGVNGDTT